MNVAIYFTMAVITAVASQLFLKKGMAVFSFDNFSLEEIFGLIKFCVSNKFILGGLLLYSVSFFFWLIVLSKTKLSIAYPITSLNFILVIAASHYFFEEKLAHVQYCGIVLIIIGVFFLASK